MKKEGKGKAREREQDRRKGSGTEESKQHTQENSLASLQRYLNIWHSILFSYNLTMDVKLISYHQVPGWAEVRVCLLLVLSRTQRVKVQGFIIIAASLSLSRNRATAQVPQQEPGLSALT